MSIQSLRTLICSVLLCTAFYANAQFNIKVGYNGNYADFKKTADIFNRFSDQFSSDDQKLKPPKIYHGIEFGARYKFSEYFGVDVGISSTNGQSKVTGLSSQTSELVDSEWKISHSNLYLGLENYVGSYGYGATLGYQRLKYTNKTNLNSESLEILKQNALNSKFYLIFEYASSVNSFSFRPFVTINWQPYNFHTVELAIFPDTKLPITDYDEDLMVFGISLIIYNGPQK
ncbi:MAG: hypothetical protein ACJA1A_002894 [Saprospiraceae bacterium]|jgi:hypothetical protein